MPSERCCRRGSPPHPGRTVVDARQLGDLQIDRGPDFRQVGRLTSQLIALRELTGLSAAGGRRGFDLIGQRLHLQPVGRQRCLYPRTLARQSTPQFLLVRGDRHPEVFQNRRELNVEFRPAPNFSDEGPGSGQARQAGPSLRLVLHPVPPSGLLSPWRLSLRLRRFLRTRTLPDIPAPSPTRILVGADHGF